MSWIRYRVQKKQEYSGGTWVDVVPLETRQGEEIGEFSTEEECYNREPNFLRFIPLEPTTFTWSGSTGSNTVYYSTDSGSTWTALASSATTPSFSTGTEVWWKASGLTVDFSNEKGFGTFSSSGRFNVEGDIMSLVSGNGFPQIPTIDYAYQFKHLFRGCTNLVSAENLELPATTLEQRCYWGMFDGCTSLTTAPSVLPATTMAIYCYTQMFSGCTSLTTAPILPATTLADYCYSRMFNGCTSLTSAPALPATTLAIWCYSAMFSGCTSLTTAPTLPATTLEAACYYGMFYDCTSLTTAPALPATTMVDWCYGQMFYGCSGLTSAPVLPAATLANKCYFDLFRYCSSLNKITCLATDISAEDCTMQWVHGVASSGTFTKAFLMNDWTIGGNGIPNGWTVQNY